MDLGDPWSPVDSIESRPSSEALARLCSERLKLAMEIFTGQQLW